MRHFIRVNALLAARCLAKRQKQKQQQQQQQEPQQRQQWKQKQQSLRLHKMMHGEYDVVWSEGDKGGGNAEKDE